MVRPKKWRNVCSLPEINKFGPIDISENVNESIIMTVEEYETIRLMDLEGLNQVETADTMQVARSTVQRIYNDARKKLADSLVNGKVLIIEGGNYRLCSDFDNKRNCNVCKGNRHGHGHRHGRKNSPAVDL